MIERRTAAAGAAGNGCTPLVQLTTPLHDQAAEMTAPSIVALARASYVFEPRVLATPWVVEGLIVEGDIGEEALLFRLGAFPFLLHPFQLRLEDLGRHQLHG
jgi:hypothetical protein